jgi:hypothetical protein
VPPEFYPPELTQLSERTLGEVLAVVPEAILIGGWASHFRVGTPRTHDVDLVLQPHELDMLAARWPMIKTTHLGTTWRAEANGIHVDLYVPNQSTLGTRLQLPVSALPPHAVSLEGRRVLDAPAHLATKLAALLDRPDTLPGEKDREEVWLLLRVEAPDPGQIASVLAASSLRGSTLTAAVDEALGYLRDLPLSRTERAWLRTTSAHVGAAVAELGGSDQVATRVEPQEGAQTNAAQASRGKRDRAEVSPRRQVGCRERAASSTDVLDGLAGSLDASDTIR